MTKSPLLCCFPNPLPYYLLLLLLLILLLLLFSLLLFIFSFEFPPNWMFYSMFGALLHVYLFLYPVGFV